MEGLLDPGCRHRSSASPARRTTWKASITAVASGNCSVQRTFGQSIGEGSMDLARFVAHLRYLFGRGASGKQIDDPVPTSSDAISNAHPGQRTSPG